MINLSTLYSLSRTVHRIFVVAMLTCTMVMGGTGVLLKYPKVAGLLPIDSGMIRAIHGDVSIWFLIILLGMAVTGTFMYAYPWYLRSKTRRELRQTQPGSQ